MTQASLPEPSPHRPELAPGTGEVKDAPGMTTERLLGWLIAYRLNMHAVMVLPQLVANGWLDKGWTRPHPANPHYAVLTEVGKAITDLNAAEYGTSFVDAEPPPMPGRD